MLLGLMLWNVISLWPRAHPAVTLPYTAFLAQVRADNVARVRLAGADISGDFIRPVRWAEPTPSTPASIPPPPEAPSGTPVQPSPSPPTTYKAFRATFPEVVGDSSLLPLLEAHHVVVEAAPPPSHWLTLLFIEGLPTLLLVGFFAWMGRRAGQNPSSLFNFGRTRARRYTRDQPAVTFDDVAGADEAKAQLEEEVDFLSHPQKYHALGARIPRGVLLVGPPGTGKTLLARAVAGEAGVPFFSISASEFVEMFVGVGASRVRDLFVQAMAEAPAIVYIDEPDAVGRRRGAGVGTVNDEREQTLNQLLVEKVLLGAEHPRLADMAVRRIVAIHESGHAVVAWVTPAADPVHKVTITPHGRALGMTAQLPGEEHYNYSRTYLLARLDVMLGGRAAEEIVLNEVTTGAEQDLVEATRLAKRMVTRWGMGELGLVAFEADDIQPFLGYDLTQGRDYSEATAARIDQNVQRLLEARHERVCQLLTAARAQLDQVVEMLLHEETVRQDTLARILGPHPTPLQVSSQQGEVPAHTGNGFPPPTPPAK